MQINISRTISPVISHTRQSHIRALTYCTDSKSVTGENVTAVGVHGAAGRGGGAAAGGDTVTLNPHGVHCSAA